MRNSFIAKLYEIAKNDKNVILLAGDLGYGVLDKFRFDLPKQFINVGISEQNMMSMAAGLALQGKIVYVYSIGNFPSLRCLEQIRNDVCYHNANVKIICVGAGFAYGALGMSHHATEDVAIMRALPNIEIYSPADKIEAEMIAEYAYATDKPVYIRLGKGGEPLIHNVPIIYEKGMPIEVEKGKDLLFITYGDIAQEAIKAVNLLNDKNISCGIVTLPILKPLQERVLKLIMGNYKAIVTLEEQNIRGVGSIISDIMTENRVYKPIMKLGLADTYCNIVGNQNYLRDYYGISDAKIVEKVLNWMGELNK